MQIEQLHLIFSTSAESKIYKYRSFHIFEAFLSFKIQLIFKF